MWQMQDLRQCHSSCEQLNLEHKSELLKRKLGFIKEETNT